MTIRVKPLYHIGAYSAVILAWMALEYSGHFETVTSALTIPLLLILPGYLVFRLLRRDNVSHESWATFIYSVAISLLFIMVGGLFVNLIWPLFGITNPLTRGPLVTSFGPALLGLIGLVGWRRGNIITIKRFRPRYSEILAATLGTILPALAVMGAISLNNGGSNALTIIMLCCVSLLGLIMMWPPLQSLKRIHPYLLYGMALGILLSNSMRGWFITGHDVVQEYQVFQITMAHSHWSMSYLRDAYNACLSITILPTVLARLTHINDPYIYKAVFQAIFALMAPLIYVLVSRFANRSAAILSAFIFMSFPTFITDMTMLGRQELAFVFFGLLIMTLCNDRLPTRTRSALVFLLSLGMILSHYSTSYVALGIILLAKAIETAMRFRLKHLRPTWNRKTASPLSWAITLAMLLTVYLWNSQLTATSQGIAATISGITTSLPKLLQRNTQSGVNKYSLVGKSLTDEEVFKQYTDSIPASREFEPGAYYPDAATAKYPVKPAQGAIDAPTGFGNWLKRFAPIPFYDFYDSIRSLYAKLVQIAIVIGLGLLIFRWKQRIVPRQYLYLSLAALGVIALQVLLPSSIINYGLLRLIQQSLLLLAPAIIMAFASGWSVVRISESWRPRLTALVFVGFFIVNANLLPEFTGGYKPALSTSNSGFYYEAYYTHADEIAGFQWLANHAPTGSVVFADEFARRKMITYAGIYARSNLAPAAITQDSYVFISDANSTFNRVPFYFDGTLLYEQPPTDFLANTKNLVYTNGNVRIYK